MKHTARHIVSIGAGLSLAPTLALAQNAGSVELAKQLSNPVASLISVPLQFNFDENIGTNDEGRRTTTNLQPVIPFSIGEDWNLISRTIVPYIHQEDATGRGETQEGFGDIVQSLFFSPKSPTGSGWIWGVGPVIYVPTGSSDFSADQWGLGPTAVVLRQQDGWTYGALANHIWGLNSESGDDTINSTFLQPFVSYTTANSWTFTLNTESTYDWNNKQWSVPLLLGVSKLVTVGDQPISLSGSVRNWVEGPANGPEGTAFRLGVTFLFPR